MQIKDKGPFLILVFILSHTLSLYSEPVDKKSAVIYYNEACSDCTIYINKVLLKILKEAGIKNIIKKDYINEKASREELIRFNDRIGLPPMLQGHFTIVIDEKIILEGHVPERVIKDILKRENQDIFERIVIFQDDMHRNAETYRVWAFKGDIKVYSIDTPISEYLNWFQENKGILKTLKYPADRLWNFKSLLFLVLLGGLLDGINPCAIAVLLFFMAFLFTIHHLKKNILKIGIFYIIAIYLTYLGIGLGVLRAFMITNKPHLMAKVGAGLVIFLGLINVKDYFRYGKWISLSVPKVSKNTLDRWMHKGTISATIVLGFLVGLCTFPCTGGIYVAILGLLGLRTTYLKGFFYLLLYNIMFVVPLVAILSLVSNRRVLSNITRWEESKKEYIKLITGVVMILLGISILIWLI